MLAASPVRVPLMPAHVYLAGPITGLSYREAVDWREDFSLQLPNHIVPLSPMRGKALLREERSIKGAYDETVMSNAKAITARDRWDVQRSDVIVVNLMYADTVSIGTMIELGWADSARVPIVLAMEEGGTHEHAIVREVTAFRVYDLGDALMVVKKLLPGRRVEL
jgi:nucleoside 2-deoxyribosyltransferase